MSRRRVFVTGIGLASPIGNDPATVVASLRGGRHGIRVMDDWAQYGGLVTRLGAPVEVDLKGIPRKAARTMGRVAQLAAYATQRAVDDARLDPATLQNGRTGIAYGSTHGSSAAANEWTRTLVEKRSIEGVPSTLYLKFMSHTCAASLAVLFGVRGRILTTCAACVSGSQGIGQGYEAIRAGHADVMICGGAEELHPSHAAVFELFLATSRGFADRPDESPRPFDVARDGLVIGEGAGTLILESEEHARARGATIHGEILGFGTNCDGSHATAPSPEGMAAAMRLALADAAIDPARIAYVNAHGTGTDVGDVAESIATREVLGENVWFSSTKGFTGHTLGACGAIESAFCLAMMREGFVAPNRTLDELDPRCARLRYAPKTAVAADLPVVMNDNFAFGGINTSLIFARVDD